MKALMLQKYNHLEYIDVPTPKMGDNEVLIGVQACGICGSDVQGIDGSSGRRQPPIIMGHEAAGDIIEVGRNVRRWKKGDRVTFDSTIYCGQCEFCREGKINLCDQRRVLGVSCDDYRQQGAFAEYVAIPEHILYRLPEELSMAQAAMVEAVSIAVHAVGRRPIKLNDAAVVVGAGMIGLLVIQALRLVGCGKIIAIDIDSDHLNLASELGSDVRLNPEQCDVAHEVQEQTKGYGADIAFEVVGITPTINMAITSLRKGGSLIMVGNLTKTVDMPLQEVVTREITLYGSCASCGEYSACMEMIARGAINVDSIISTIAPLSEGKKWFERLYQKEKGLMKVILTPDGAKI